MVRLVRFLKYLCFPGKLDDFVTDFMPCFLDRIYRISLIVGFSQSPDETEKVQSRCAGGKSFSLVG